MTARPGHDKLARAVRAGLATAAEPARAPQMQAYMRSALPFLGVGVPVVRRLTRLAADRLPPTDAAGLEATTRALWHDATFREERYAALALLDTRAGRALRGPHQLPLLDHLIRDGAWWDYVDELSHRVGELLTGWPEQVRPHVWEWADGADLWSRRSAIICQLGRRSGTDLDLLTHAIEANQERAEFWLRKAIGWALRDYARTDADWVRTFVATHPLSPLSRREALKHLTA